MKSNDNPILIIVTLLILLSAYTYAQPNYPTNPEMAEMKYTDVTHFVEAFEKLAQAEDSLTVLNKFYFDRASIGLKEYINRHGLTPLLLKDAIAESPEQYKKIGQFLDDISLLEQEYLKTLKNFHGVLPSSMYPPTYLLVGANRGIAQASKVGQLVTITRVVDDQDKLKRLIVHELAHFQQAKSMGIQNYAALYGQQNNMLGLCLREGGAEFITSLVLGNITKAETLEYFQNHESALKTRFVKDLENQDMKYWMWDSIKDESVPQLLGYVMGYQICKAFYENNDDKSKAMESILVMESPEKFLEESGYLNN